MVYNFLMLVVHNLNLKPGWGYRCAPPKGQFKFEFQLDKKSEYFLTEAASKCRTELEVQEFEDAVEQSVYKAIFKMDGQELSDKEIPPYIRLVIDPTDKNRLFGFQIKNAPEKDKLIITKLKIFGENNC